MPETEKHIQQDLSGAFWNIRGHAMYCSSPAGILSRSGMLLMLSNKLRTSSHTIQNTFFFSPERVEQVEKARLQTAQFFLPLIYIT